MPKIWDCKIGECDDADLPPGSDLPMREAVAKAVRREGASGRVFEAVTADPKLAKEK